VGSLRLDFGVILCGVVKPAHGRPPIFRADNLNPNWSACRSDDRHVTEGPFGPACCSANQSASCPQKPTRRPTTRSRRTPSCNRSAASSTYGCSSSTPASTCPASRTPSSKQCPWQGGSEKSKKTAARLDWRCGGGVQGVLAVLPVGVSVSACGIWYLRPKSKTAKRGRDFWRSYPFGGLSQSEHWR
jgi:hypothetical protein